MGLDALPLSGFVSPVASSVMAALKWADRRRLALLNTLIVPFIVGLVVTPLLLAGGATSTATAFYRFFHLLCHQWAFRSFFVLGTQATYSRDQLSALGVDPYSFVGDAQMGWKMAFCERNVAIFVGLLAFGLALGLVHRQSQPASFAQFAVLVSPMALDGQRSSSAGGKVPGSCGLLLASYSGSRAAGSSTRGSLPRSEHSRRKTRGS